MMFLLILLAPLYASTTQPSAAPSGPRAISTYQTMPGKGYYQYYSNNGFLEWNMLITYDQCVAECEIRGSDCWGFQTINGYCDYLLSREPPSDAPRYDTVSSNGERVGVVYKKITQMWIEELERCMGLTFDWSPANPEECRIKCAMDENCHVYQWYLKTLENEEVVGECFLDKGANTYDCSDSHALEGFEVVEGHRKQESSVCQETCTSLYDGCENQCDNCWNHSDCLEEMGFESADQCKATACANSCESNDDCEDFCNFDSETSGYCELCSDISDSCVDDNLETAEGRAACQEVCESGSGSSSSITVEPTASPADSIRRLIRRKL